VEKTVAGGIRDVTSPNVDGGWLEKGRRELDGLDTASRSPGDDALALDDDIAPAMSLHAPPVVVLGPDDIGG
jgi:hypothetical protein